MPIYKLEEEKIQEIESVSFVDEKIYERQDLQSLIVNSIEAIEEGLFVVTNEFNNWVDSRRSIDILCIDRDANLVVIELKRTDDGGHMELQAIRYAGMVSALKYNDVITAHEEYLKKLKINEPAQERILKFLDWNEPYEENFGKDVRIILISADFSKEITTSVLWLNERDLDIKCVRIKPYKLKDNILLDIQQVIPLPEVSEYQTKIKEKISEERMSRRQGSNRDTTKYDVTINGVTDRNLNKRKLIYFIVENFIKNGIKPEELELGSRFLALNGEFNSESEIEEEFNKMEKKYDKSRWLVTKPYIIDGKTYILSKEWGTGVPEAVDRIKNKFKNISFSIIEAQ